MKKLQVTYRFANAGLEELDNERSFTLTASDRAAAIILKEDTAPTDMREKEQINAFIASMATSMARGYAARHTGDRFILCQVIDVREVAE